MTAARVRFALALLLATPSLVPAQAPEGIPIRGRVLQADGRPAPGASLGTGWWFDSERHAAYGAQKVWPASLTRKVNGWRFVLTEEDGSFDARILPRKGKVQLIIFSKDRNEGRAFAWDAKAKLDKLELKLKPLGRLQATITCEEIGLSAVPATAYLQSVDGRRLGRFLVRDGTINIRVPEGHYRLYLYGAHKQFLGRRTFPCTVAPGELVQIKTLDLPANETARFRGRPMPPWHATAARGVELQDATFAQFRGKWLLVNVFRLKGNSPWRSQPRWIDFDAEWRRQNPGREPPYAILLINSKEARTLEELEQKIRAGRYREKHWKGRKLPFPILLDPEGKTAARWNLRWSEQTLLFDPKGRLWGEADLCEELEKIAAGLLKPAPPFKLRKPGKER